jgi:predicted alpha/beta hydrolase family esterase
MFIAALFIKEKRWQQPIVHQWIQMIQNVVQTHTMEYYSILKREEILTCYNMDEP